VCGGGGGGRPQSGKGEIIILAMEERNKNGSFLGHQDDNRNWLRTK
jgi:hypothetical protein